MIKQFKDEYKFLSNFFESPVLYRGITFNSAEHAFQAAKSENMEGMLWIAEAETPGIAKRRGRQISLRQDWEQVKIEQMYVICFSKFQDEMLQKSLLLTSPHELVEGNYWHDQFWGDCFCVSHKDTPGRNYLGRILMHIRDSKLR